MCMSKNTRVLLITNVKHISVLSLSGTCKLSHKREILLSIYTLLERTCFVII